MDDVAADTRIRATLIHAIEADSFEPCGGAVYARGHIRSIARVVGVDAAPLVAEFDAAHQVEPPVAAVAVAAGPTDPEAVARAERRGPNWAAAMVVALVAICGLALAGLLVGRSHNGGHPTLGTKGQSSTQQVKKHPSAPPPSAVAALPPTKATMQIRTLNGRTWLSITTKSGKPLFSGLLLAGQQKTFTDKRGLAFVIGNAPAVDVVVNGHDIGSPPSSGSVSRGDVTPGSNTVQQA